MNSDRKLIINAFDNSVNEFIEDLKSVFPQEKYLWSYHSFFSLGMKNNPVDVIKKFKEYVMPFKEYINNGDDSIFMDFNQENNKLGVSKDYIDDGLRLKELWCKNDTTEHTKACIIAHLQKIIKICENF